jgi:hypothetical protein
MSTHHEEFPFFTPEARAAFDAALSAITSTTATISSADFRRALAASLRKAIKQASKSYGYSKQQFSDELQAIANNLHNPPPPPPPPTLTQAREAARQLAGADAEIVHAFLATLGEGVQP